MSGVFGYSGEAIRVKVKVSGNLLRHFSYCFNSLLCAVSMYIYPSDFSSVAESAVTCSNIGKRFGFSVTLRLTRADS